MVKDPYDKRYACYKEPQGTDLVHRGARKNDNNPIRDKHPDINKGWLATLLPWSVTLHQVFPYELRGN